jgi:enoyl-CoA hydratase
MTHTRRDRDGAVLTLTFTRDEKYNAVSAEMIEALRSALDDLEERTELRVLVVGAEGRHFSAGMDINAIDLGAAHAHGETTSGVEFRRYYRHLHALFDRIEQIEKPVVLAVQGPCRGIALEFGVSCDFRLCSTEATFSLPEVELLAAIPGSGGISRLTRLVGPHWARWMALAGRTVTAERALMIGLVHEVFPAEGFRREVEAFAQHLASLPPEAVGLAKLTIDAAATVDRGTARDVDRIVNTILVTGAEHKERIDAFRLRDRKT